MQELLWKPIKSKTETTDETQMDRLSISRRKKEWIMQVITRKAIYWMKNTKVAGRIVEGRQEMGKNYVSHYKDNQILVQWQGNIQENQRRIFVVKTVSRIYESVLKIQNVTDSSSR